MDRHPHWLPQLIRKTNKYHIAGANFVGKYILDYMSTAAFTPKFIPTAPRPMAPSHSASPTPIRLCNSCRRATRSLRR